MVAWWALCCGWSLYFPVCFQQIGLKYSLIAASSLPDGETKYYFINISPGNICFFVNIKYTFIFFFTDKRSWKKSSSTWDHNQSLQCCSHLSSAFLSSTMFLTDWVYWHLEQSSGIHTQQQLKYKISSLIVEWIERML